MTSSAPAGRGTSADPYRIANLEDLRRLSLDTAVWAAHFVQIADIDASPTATWDSGRGFHPIGRTRFKYFTGFCNGRGHAISGLTIHRDTSGELGLFGFFLYANRIDSIRLVDVSIRGRSRCGGLVGGLVGSSLGASVLLSYWDGEATGQSLGLGSSRVGDSVFVAFGRTMGQMKAQATCVGW